MNFIMSLSHKTSFLTVQHNYVLNKTEPQPSQRVHILKKRSMISYCINIPRSWSRKVKMISAKIGIAVSQLDVFPLIGLLTDLDFLSSQGLILTSTHHDFLDYYRNKFYMKLFLPHDQIRRTDLYFLWQLLIY